MPTQMAARVAGSMPFSVSPLERWIPRASVVVLTLGYVALAFSNIRGDLLNSYPWVTLDGFDWVYEGHAVRALFLDHRDVNLPVLRNPVYVVLAALDALFGGTGHFLLAAQAAALAAQLLLTIHFCEALDVHPIVRAAAPLLVAFPVLWDIRMFLFADDVAIAFLLWAAYALVRWHREPSPRWLVHWFGALVFGTLTQVYVAAAAFVGLGLVVATRRHAFERRRALAIVTILAGSASVLLGRAWRAAVPHQYEPDHWSLLDARFPQLLVNARIWAVTWWPLVALAALSAWRLWRDERNRWAAAYLAILCVAFAVLTAAYRWPDARFTYFWYPMVVWLACAALRRDPQRLPVFEGGAAAVGVAAILAFHVTGWTPLRGLAPLGQVPHLHMATLSAAIERTRPLDRFDLATRCGPERRFCDAAGDGHPETGYDAVILCEYRRLRLGDASAVSAPCGDLLARGVPCFRPAR